MLSAIFRLCTAIMLGLHLCSYLDVLLGEVEGKDAEGHIETLDRHHIGTTPLLLYLDVLLGEVEGEDAERHIETLDRHHIGTSGGGGGCWGLADRHRGAFDRLPNKVNHPARGKNNIFLFLRILGQTNLLNLLHKRSTFFSPSPV